MNLHIDSVCVYNITKFPNGIIKINGSTISSTGLAVQVDDLFRGGLTRKS